MDKVRMLENDLQAFEKTFHRFVGRLNRSLEGELRQSVLRSQGGQSFLSSFTEQGSKKEIGQRKGRFEEETTPSANKLSAGIDSLGEAFKRFDQDILSHFTTVLTEGRFELESFSRSFKSFGQSLFKSGLSDLFGSNEKGGLGFLGGIGKIFGFAQGGAVRAATGGFISGPGGPTADQIPAFLSNGEFVVNAKATKEWGPLLAAINQGRVPGFSAGGFVPQGSRALSEGNADMKSLAVQSLQGGKVEINAPITITFQNETRNTGESLRRENTESSQSKRTLEENNLLSKKISRSIRQELESLIDQRVLHQMRPGGVIDRYMK